MCLQTKSSLLMPIWPAVRDFLFTTSASPTTSLQVCMHVSGFEDKRIPHVKRILGVGCKMKSKIVSVWKAGRSVQGDNWHVSNCMQANGLKNISPKSKGSGLKNFVFRNQSARNAFHFYEEIVA